MLRSMVNLKDYAIHATDGSIGHVKDFYFDDSGWAVRYLVVETGSWLLSRKVLISPIAIGKPNWAGRALSVLITKEQVKNSPDIDTEKPVSRQHESQYVGYYGYSMYWGGSGLWGDGGYPAMMMPGYSGYGAPSVLLSQRNEMERTRIDDVRRRQNDDIHLRSCDAVIGYHIQASDGEIGHVAGMLFDDETWAIRYLIIDTSNWWLGHQVLISPLWIEELRWSESKVFVSVTRQAVKDAAPYDVAIELDRDEEINLHRHHQRVGYWEGNVKDESVESVK